MRQLSPLSNLLLACLSALGLVACLGLPWYGPAGPADDGKIASGPGPMEQLADHIARTFSTQPGAVAAGDVLGSARPLILIAAGVVIALSLAMLVPALRAPLRDALRAAGLATPLLVAFLALERAVDGMELRWGVPAMVAVAGFMASAAWHGSTARERRAPTASWSRPAA
ncbi:MAG TPA: hypothetical protein VM266_00335 [Solirubrobacteraceae bacterium]|nr:hypothetical protein [Solirubrobacteraceae bacterium]